MEIMMTCDGQLAQDQVLKIVNESVLAQASASASVRPFTAEEVEQFVALLCEENKMIIFEGYVYSMI